MWECGAIRVHIRSDVPLRHMLPQASGDLQKHGSIGAVELLRSLGHPVVLCRACRACARGARTSPIPPG